MSNVRSWRIVLQNSKNGFQRFFREKSNQAITADRCALKRATEVADQFIASCCGPPRDYSIAAPTARKICLHRSIRVLQQYLAEAEVAVLHSIPPSARFWALTNGGLPLIC